MAKLPLPALPFGRRSNKYANDITFIDYYNRLKDIAINEFEWMNLPDTVDERYLELTLFDLGYCLFFKHALNDAYLVQQCTMASRQNLYYIPIEREVVSITGLQQRCSDLDSVIIFNNRLRQPTSPTIELYAIRLTNIERAIDINLNAQKTPFLIRGTKEEERSLKTMYDMYDGNIPVIFGDKDLDLNALTVLRTDAPVHYPDLMIAKRQVWAEAMGFLGINNANTDKRERLVSAEVEANDEQLEIARYTRLNARKEACRMINDLFGLNIDVRFRRLTRYVETGEGFTAEYTSSTEMTEDTEGEVTE